MANKELLISHIRKLSEDEILSLLDAVALMRKDTGATPKTACPFCKAQSVIRYGFKCGKQRFQCKNCGRTFVSTTNTIMSHSHFHFPVSVWNEMIADTIHGSAIDYSAKRLGLYHQAAFDMRHKILLALQELPEVTEVRLGDVSEFDETFVLDCYKGKKLDGTVARPPVNMAQKQRKGAFPMNIFASVQESSEKGMPLPLRSTGQTPAPGS